MKHQHEWEEFRHNSKDPKPYAIKCKICKKVSFPYKTVPMYIRHGKIHYHTTGAFGGR
jgi:hypothetical protein